MEVDIKNAMIRCMACMVYVDGENSRREHYRSDWHSANLRRKLTGLPPMSCGEFNSVALEKAQTEIAEDKGLVGKQCCILCSKTFSSVNAFHQHLRSQRHLKREVESGTLEAAAHEGWEADLIDERLETASPIPLGICVFCGTNFTAKDAHDEILEHMARIHGFFLPYIDCVVRLEDILLYLGDKVGVGYACVACTKPHSSVAAVRDHMNAKSHCRMASDEDAWCEEYMEFYNFEHYEGVVPQQASWVDVSEGPMVDPLIEGGGNTVEELMLPSGVAGHRSLNRYYKQRLHTSDSRAATILNKVDLAYRRILQNGSSEDFPQQIRAHPSKAILERVKSANLRLGQRAYYSRKSRVKPGISVLNSGYRP
uniref:C2H2-type domain-containing protein n=1 Tax=Compsopogon caeruleus TaxID=31354 RepID=A0A7S1TJN8_9RHOD|mmetsp:Transcript_9786/g.19926  ORF Transcript_9786/g.19926 Transcript_9786/m.19926 type:complete len:368 (+) Transcript_9786:213-1316(+)|eukprot:CAMPEP_0184683426 /NCGR_PEP_ID=MMETSP0312-20130426/11306_1 /TAXON_ID=31354 /ORGANISM="Compsopogon coeruleus, Strain SAG 36.94" /LENGTH=367 /DNA_ID=CAMNT_0027135785 /DNA_START=114 /DNA_END=1217 /DNA_ORIENTATION=+